LNQLVGDLPEALGVFGVKYVGRNPTGVADALMYHGRLGAVFEVAAGDALDVGTGGQ
jgi:hypothetical protein